jgi:hypothetical protein
MNARRLINRLPEHYHAYDEKSLINIILHVIGEELDRAENAINALRVSRWIDFADYTDLRRLGKLIGVQPNFDESSDEFRTRLRVTIDELMVGMGTVDSLNKLIETTIGVTPEIIENPRTLEISDEKIVSSGEGWFVHNRSMAVTNPTIYVSGINDTLNPSIINVTTQESVTFHGVLKKGDYLVIHSDCKSVLSGEDVSNKITSTTGRTPTLPIGISEWRYIDASGSFDYSKFDNATFCSEKTGIQLRWEKSEPATFVVKLPIKKMKQDIRELIDNVKPAGVIAKVNYWDKFHEVQSVQKDYIKPIFNTTNREVQSSGTDVFTVATRSIFREKMVITDKLVIGDVFGIAKFNKSKFG